jgi:hypothetical protein
MSDFSSKGYITLDELDNLVKRIDQLEKDLGSTSSTTTNLNNIFSKAANLVFYKNDKSTGKVSNMLNIKSAGIDTQRVKTKISDKGTLVIKFGQKFTQAPIVIASADTYKDDFLVTVDNVDKDKCTLRFIRVASRSKTAAGSSEYINIIAIGTTSD